MHRAASPPQNPQLSTEIVPGEIRRLSHDACHAEIEIAGSALSGQHASGVSFRSARLTDVDLSGGRLEQLGLSDASLRSCNLANVLARRANLDRVVIGASRLTGLGLPESALRDVTVRDCRVDLASFGFSRLTRVTFEDCLLAQSDFLEAELQSVRFVRCDLTGADFRGARMRECEIRGSRLEGLQGIDGLRGAALEWPAIVEMAGAWAAALGIGVLDAD